jgi:hypothetical protein
VGHVPNSALKYEKQHRPKFKAFIKKKGLKCGALKIFDWKFIKKAGLSF